MVRTSARAAALLAVALGVFAGFAGQASAATCDKSWSGGAGSWDDAAKWSPSGAPGGADRVCIVASGTYTVTLKGGTRTIAGLTLGGPTGTQTLLIEGFFNGTGTLALTAQTAPDSDGVGANGRIVLRGEAGGTGFSLGQLVIQSGTLTNAGSIVSDPGGGGQNRIAGDLLNTGTLEVNHPLDSDATSDWESSGTVTIAAAGSVAQAGTFSWTGGTIANGGAFRQTTGTFAHTGGSLTGNPFEIQSATLAPSGGGPASFLVTTPSTATLGSDVGAQNTILIAASANGQAILVVNTSRTNNGRIELEGAGTNLAFGRLDIQSGTLTNAGTIVSDPTTASENRLTGDLLNTGTLEINDELGSDAGSDWTNNGTFDVAANVTLDLQGTLTNFSGTTLTGGTYVLEGIFQFPGANIATNAATISLLGNGATIRNRTTSADALAALAANTASGTLDLQNGKAFTTSVAFSNAGAVTISATGPSSFTSTGDYTQSGGTTDVFGTLTASGGQVQLNGGLLRGSGTVQPLLVNAAEVRPGTSPGTLSVTGSYTQTAAGTLRIEIAGTSPGTQYDRLAVSGMATLAGTLSGVTSGGFTPTSGQMFQVVTFGSASGTFTTVNAPGFDVEYHPGDVTLVANGSPTAVRVLGFSAAPARAVIVVRWRTGSERGVLGFNLYRVRAGKLVRLNRSLVRAVGGARGAAYVRRDPAGRPGSRYRLQAVALDGSRSWLAATAVRRS
ncbi:MAG: hypothetical protein ABR521_11905 [Gaiellaceae bacterium]